MHELKTLLVVLNPATTEQTALNKAVSIIRHTGGSLTALLQTRTAEPELLTRLQEQLKQLRQSGLSITLRASDEKDLLRAVLLSLHEQQYNLIVKAPQPSGVADALFTSKDSKLLRTSSVPVLMVRSAQQTEGAPILAAVEAQPADQEHLHLNNCILKRARWIAGMFRQPLHLFSALPSPMQDPIHHHNNPQQQLQDYTEACLALAGRYDIPANQVHVASGPAELLIPDQCKALDAQLLVLGTVARTGLRGALLGNTAEQILERVDTNILVIPPTQD